jgi:NAD dependent epimerase/dehydratase family enzyme
MSWIHIDDVTGAMLFLMNRDDLMGVFNLVSPQPVRNKEFARTLGKILKRPWFFPVPAFVLKTLFGEMAQEIMLSSQRTTPKRLLDTGFPFRYPQLEEALRGLLDMSI